MIKIASWLSACRWSITVIHASKRAILSKSYHKRVSVSVCYYHYEITLNVSEKRFFCLSIYHRLFIWLHFSTKYFINLSSFAVFGEAIIHTTKKRGCPLTSAGHHQTNVLAQNNTRLPHNQTTTASDHYLSVNTVTILLLLLWNYFLVFSVSIYTKYLMKVLYCVFCSVTLLSCMKEMQ